MTLKQVAEYLQVSIMTVKRYIYQGKLRTLKTPGGQHRIRRPDVEAMLKEFTSTPLNDIKLDDALDIVSTMDEICRRYNERLKAEIMEMVERRMDEVSHECKKLKGYCLLKGKGDESDL
ncbi:MAG: helix-turn-helix domain-containing protein [Armatimonadetes bacterium]|nr:helix-turn-helix domain-containing protein [Armatimonadota bacterium]